jgi:hypothetical protein
MLRKVLFTITMSAMIAMALATLAVSQMTNIGTKPQEHAKNAQPGMTTQNSMRELWKEQQSLADEWAKIEEHYGQMMKITDPTQLRAEMVKHQEMMTAYNNKMMTDQGMWHRAMTAYEPSATKSGHTGSGANYEKKNMAAPMNH